jgi:hypothetical protein
VSFWRSTDLTRDERRVGCPFRTATHGADDLQAVFVAHFLGRRKYLGSIGIAHDLHQAFAISQVNENDAAMVAPSMYPAEQSNRLADEFGVDQARVFGSHKCSVGTFRDAGLLRSPAT